MISKIYSSNTTFFKVGERKGKSKQEIEKMMSKRTKKTKTKNLKQSEQKLSHFINCNRGYFNKGKHKGKSIDRVPVNYLMWVLKNVLELNNSEKKILTKNIKLKLKTK